MDIVYQDSIPCHGKQKPWIFTPYIEVTTRYEHLLTHLYILANEEVLLASKELSPDIWEGGKSTFNPEGVYHGEPKM